MTWIESSALGLSCIIFMIGLVCALLPVIPGSLIVWLGVLVHKLWLGDASVSWQIVIFTAVLTLIGQIAELVMGVWGARRFGASWKGTLGALLGALIGFFCRRRCCG